MSIQFPASPSTGDTYLDPTSGTTWEWDGDKWVRAFAVVGVANTTLISQGNTTAKVVDTGSDGSFQVLTEGTERLRVDSNGDVGIGTNVPDNKLHVFAGDSSGSSSAQAQFTIENSGNSGLQFLAGTSSVSEIRFGDSGDNGAGSIAYSHSDNSVRFGTNNGTEKVRIDSSGRLLVGTSTVHAYNQFGQSPRVQVVSSGGSLAGLLLEASSSDGNNLVFRKSGGSAGSNTIVTNNQEIGTIRFTGTDGTNPFDVARIASEIDGTPGANDMPGRLVFSTTADGADSPTERMRITQGGAVKMATTGSYYSGTSYIHEMSVDNDGDWISYFTNAATSLPYGLSIRYTGSSPNNTTSDMIHCEDTNATRFQVRSNGGVANFSSNNANLCDEREKKNIETLDSTWGCLKNWELKKFHYNEDADTDDKRYGVIAQQVAPLP